MLDLVGNPKDRFSRDVAHFDALHFLALLLCLHRISPFPPDLMCPHLDLAMEETSWNETKTTYEPRCEKTGLRGFRPGPTQTGLYNHTRWLEA